MNDADRLVEARARVATLQQALTSATARVHELEALAVAQNDRIIEVMRAANRAEKAYRELLARWETAQRGAALRRAVRRGYQPSLTFRRIALRPFYAAGALA
jgi:uncharacterized protein YPO0396